MKKRILKITLIILILLNVFVLIYNYLSDSNSSFIVFDRNNVWKVKDGNVTQTSKNKIKKLNFAPAKLYNNSRIDGYFEGGNKYNFYDQSLQSNYDLFDSIIVLGDLNIKNYTNLIEEIDDKDDLIIENFLSDYSLDYYKENSRIKKAKINNIIIYSVEYSMGTDSEDGYSVVFINDGDDSNLIYKITSGDNKIRSSSLSKLIDIDNDGHVEVVLLSDIPGSAGNECYSLYKYNSNSNSYKPVINCEEE